jgi:hypothetical protein
MRFCLILLAIFSATLSPARADTASAAFDRAILQLESALPRLSPDSFGVDVKAYRDVLTLRSFSSRHWGGTVRLKVEDNAKGDAACKRFAAFVRLPPNAGSISLVLCPQFFAEGSDALRTLTILHELVHVVAGPDECRAMAFAARVEQLATGRHTPVERYWQANKCAGSGFSLP